MEIIIIRCSPNVELLPVEKLLFSCSYYFDLCMFIFLRHVIGCQCLFTVYFVNAVY